MSLTRLRRRARAISLLAVGALVLSLPGGAAADTEISTSGFVGAHRLRDAFGYPGVRCMYSTGKTATGVLEQIRVRAPVVFARDSYGGLDIRTVGWRAVLQGRVAGTWKTVDTTAITKDQATDKHPAEFVGKRFTGPNPGTRFRVRIDMYWYNPAGTDVVGRSRHAVDFYAIVVDGTQQAQADGSCPVNA